MPSLPLRLVPAVALSIALVTIAAPADDAVRAGTVLSSRTGDYLEDGGSGRRIAEIRARLVHTVHGARLDITASALGARVDTVPGWTGVRGANRITARELESIWRERRAHVVTRVARTGETRDGTVRPGRRGRLPERRLRADGSIDFAAASASPVTLELGFASAPLPEGEHVTDVRIDGVSRLRVRTAIDAQGARITGIESLPGWSLDS